MYKLWRYCLSVTISYLQPLDWSQDAPFWDTRLRFYKQSAPFASHSLLAPPIGMLERYCKLGRGGRDLLLLVCSLFLSVPPQPCFITMAAVVPSSWIQLTVSYYLENWPLWVSSEIPALAAPSWEAWVADLQSSFSRLRDLNTGWVTLLLSLLQMFTF